MKKTEDDPYGINGLFIAMGIMIIMFMIPFGIHLIRYWEQCQGN